MRNTKKNDNFTKGMFNTRSSRIGQLIGHDFSPAVFRDPEMGQTDLSYVVSDKSKIMDLLIQQGVKYEQVKSALEYFPNGKILFFHCIENTLTKQEICDFFNRVCTLVPFKLSPNDMQDLGTVTYTKGFKDGLRHTFWGVDIDQYEPSGASRGKTDNGENKESAIASAFQKLLGKSEELKSADVSVKYAKKEDLEKYFRRDKSGWNKLEDGVSYLVVFIYGDKMDENGVSKLANEIGKEAGSGGSYSTSDVVNLGIIRKKYPGSDSFENYDVFAVKFA